MPQPLLEIHSFCGLRLGRASPPFPDPALFTVGVLEQPLPCWCWAPPTFQGQGGEDRVLGGRSTYILEDLLHRGRRRSSGQHHTLLGLRAHHSWRLENGGALRKSPFPASANSYRPAQLRPFIVPGWEGGSNSQFPR